MVIASHYIQSTKIFVVKYVEMARYVQNKQYELMKFVKK